MGSVYARGNSLWFSYTDSDGQRKWVPSGYKVGDEKEAEKCLKKMEDRIAAEIEHGVTSHSGPLTLKQYGEKWLKNRASDVETADDDESRLAEHVFPALGDMPINEVRPRHIRDFVRQLKRKKSARRKSVLAPRTGAERLRRAPQDDA
jgi:hypothetical protein